MENSLGFKPVLLKKTEPELIKKIAAKRGMDEALVKEMMHHDSWTVGQFADLAGKDESTINNLIVRGKQKNLTMITALRISFPWPRKLTKGSKHVMRDELSMDFLEKSLK